MLSTFKNITLFLFITSLVAIFSTWGCSSELKPCKIRSDCDTASGYTCLHKVCQLTCKNDIECGGQKCIDSICGGAVIPDSGTPEVQTECNPGETDDCYTGPDGTAGTGVCKTGTKTCNDDGKWGECVDEVKPSSEICNNEDDDCNGKVDDQCNVTVCTLGQKRPCYTAPAETKGVGRCAGGEQVCENDANGKADWSQCNGQVLPVPERCDNQEDDNCDGKTNEGCACKPGQTEKCKASNGCAGLRSCNAKPGGGGTEWGECVASKPSEDVCDGLDNDCDGEIDNVKGGTEKLTRQCLNVCFKGTEYCKEGKWKDCDADLPKSVEECNGIDDDCDGKIDNQNGNDNPIIKGCSSESTAKGICKDGAVRTCENAKWGDCKGSPPIQEKCNDLDDDCDGEVDEEGDKPCGDGAKCTKDASGVKKCVAS